ncbi:MAG TPA: lysophospholipid acyltransferase family protein [Planctomycetota bacterium]|nr:lysophospholipid acyltransferase family protein [Planctomycetota bacterium]
MTAGRAWSGRSAGGGFGHRLVAAFARFGGLHVCYALLIPPATWYFLRLHERRRETARYWRRMRPSLGRGGALVMTWAHFWSFARILADRFLVAYAPGALRSRSLGFATMRAARETGHGCVMVSAHLGNWELSGRLLASYGLGAFTLIMVQDEDPAVAAQVRAALGERAVIDLADPFAASLAIAAALSRGETCCMLADRTAGAATRTVAVPFLGGRARFPTGPFVAAAVSGAPILPVFCIKTGWRSYATFALPAWTPRFTSRAARAGEIEAAVARWARHLERMTRRWPMQWHNFYDFWAA